MRTLLCVATLGAACLSPMVAIAEESDFDPATIDLAKLIECRTYQPAQYNALAFWIAGDDSRAALARFGLSETESANPMLRIFTLKAPLTVFDRQTRQIAFASSGPLAILDEADPHPLAKSLDVKATVDTPSKFLGEREISAVSERDDKTGMTFRTRVALNVSTVASHPGKTLAGCSYRIDLAG